MNKEGIAIFEAVEETYEFVRKTMAEISAEAIEKRGRFTLALSGGATAAGLYRYLAGRDSAVLWNKTHVFLVDERFVPFDDPESNYGMIKRNLTCIKNIHPIPVGDTQQDSARIYDDELRRFFNVTSGVKPAFDLIMLGIGEDGHTASLFPGEGALMEKERLALAVTRQGLNSGRRITMTFPIINNSDNIIFLATGKNKANIVKGLVEGEDTSLPALMVKPGHGKVLVVLDKEAGSLLKEGLP